MRGWFHRVMILSYKRRRFRWFRSTEDSATHQLGWRDTLPLFDWRKDWQSHQSLTRLKQPAGGGVSSSMCSMRWAVFLLQEAFLSPPDFASFSFFPSRRLANHSLQDLSPCWAFSAQPSGHHSRGWVRLSFWVRVFNSRISLSRPVSSMTLLGISMTSLVVFQASDWRNFRSQVAVFLTYSPSPLGSGSPEPAGEWAPIREGQYQIFPFIHLFYNQ